MNRCVVRMMSIVLILAMFLAPAALGETPVVRSAIASYAWLYGYKMTQAQMEACRWDAGRKALENEVFILRSMELAYDGVVLLASANIVPQSPDVFLLPALAEMGERVGYPADQKESPTWQQALTDSGKKGVRVAVYPACLDEIGAYFVDYWLEDDGSLTLVYGTYMEVQGERLHTGWHMEARDMTSGRSAVLLDQTTEAFELSPLAPLETLPCSIISDSRPVKETALVKTFFGYTPAPVQEGELALLTEQGKLAPSLADVTYLQSLPAAVKLLYFAPDGVQVPLEAVLKP